MATIRNEILYRLYLVLSLIVLVAVAIAVQAIRISVLEGDKWRERGRNKYVQLREVEADRGNILSADGSMLATSLPYFDVGFDPNSSGMSEADFYQHVDSLAYCIATYIEPSFTPGAMRDLLILKRQEGSQFVWIKKDVSFGQMELIRTFPLFNLGQFRGGLIVYPKYRRERPFGLLAHRTIGYVRDDIKPVGLEGKFDEILSGKVGKQLMIRVEEDIWKPVEDLAKIEPKGGKDILTTLDIDIQEVTEEALFKAMEQYGAEHGTAIVMEVETGAIRAIANLGRTDDGEIWETYNYGVGTATEPGSTFKLATMMALLEGGYVELDDSLNLDKGETKFYEDKMVDAKPHGLEMTTVRHAFEISSNVGMAKLAQQHFGDRNREKQFVSYLRQFNLHEVTGVDLDGEPEPYIKDPENPDDGWSGTTLPWMATGYEVMLTPLQTLTLYNAVANDGTMMKPYLVSEIQEFGVTLDYFSPTVIKRRIASRRTINQAQELLLGVVENGTASRHKTDKYTFAGKTGTAQVNYKRLKNRTRIGGYQASFVGYFPADNPKYSCIVVISRPKSGYYGGEVALPVFRAIADRVFALKVDLRPPLNDQSAEALEPKQMPSLQVGRRRDMLALLDAFDLEYTGSAKSEMVMLRADTSGLALTERKLPPGRIPSVVGMGLRDALFVLENLGLQVEISGYGKVQTQSIKPGTPARRQKIYLKLG